LEVEYHNEENRVEYGDLQIEVSFGFEVGFVKYVKGNEDIEVQNQ